MNTQPQSRSDVEALRLAEQLETEWGDDCELEAAAAELRRLHSRELHYEMIDHQNKLLHALNQELLEALKHAASCVQDDYLPDMMGHDWDDVIAKAEANHG